MLLATRREPPETKGPLGVIGQPLAQDVPVRERRTVQGLDLVAAPQADLVGGAPGSTENTNSSAERMPVS